MHDAELIGQHTLWSDCATDLITASSQLAVKCVDTNFQLQLAAHCEGGTVKPCYNVLDIIMYSEHEL